MVQELERDSHASIALLDQYSYANRDEIAGLERKQRDGFKGEQKERKEKEQEKKDLEKKQKLVSRMEKITKKEGRIPMLRSDKEV